MQVIDFNLTLANDPAPWRLLIPDDTTQEYCVLWLQGWTSSMDSHFEGVKRMAIFLSPDPGGYDMYETLDL